MTTCPLTVRFFFIGPVLLMLLSVYLPSEPERRGEDMENFMGTKICTLNKTSLKIGNLCVNENKLATCQRLRFCKKCTWFFKNSHFCIGDIVEKMRSIANLP